MNMRTPNYTPAEQAALIKTLTDHFGRVEVTTKEVLDYSEKNKIKIPYFILNDNSRKIGRGRYTLGAIKGNKVAVKPTKTVAVAAASPAAPALAAQVIALPTKRAANVTESYVPEKNSTYVPFGFFNDLKSIIKSGVFYPVYITGLSGNGKTLMVEQICAQLNRELIRVNITKRSDEDALIGSYELIDGNTIRREGPALTAMRRGAVLLLDETDYGTEDLLCLQPILEGKPYFDKKTGEVIHPAPGFTVLATANTKGKGSDDGRFIGANTLNEAFLERFAITVEQDYPPVVAERKILQKNFEEFGVNDDKFIDHLITWAEIIRKTFHEGGVDDIISTRRLVHIAKAYSIFNNRKKAIELCLNRFDSETKTAFLDLYTKVDAEVISANVAEPAVASTEDVPF
jgi:MoxR-like ATPase